MHEYSCKLLKTGSSQTGAKARSLEQGVFLKKEEEKEEQKKKKKKKKRQ